MWSAFKIQLPLQLEDSGKSLQLKWSKYSKTLPGTGCKILWTDKEGFHAMGLEFSDLSDVSHRFNK